MHKASSLALLTMLLLARPTPTRSQVKTDVVDRGKRATAMVEVTTPRGQGSGSAFCIDKAGLFITNAHVVEAATQVRLVLDIGLKSQRSLQAKVLRSDDGFDLALLKVDADLGLTPLELGKGDALTLTDPVTAFGFPFGHLTAVAAAAAPDITVIRSRVTSLRMENGKLRFVQFDGQLNPGNSGGPVLDDAARVVGVAVATIRGAAINLAVPVRLLSEFLAAPGLVFDPPPLAYKDRSQPVTWTIKVQPPSPIARLPEGLSVVVKLATGPDEVRIVNAQPVGGGVFKVKVTPVPRDPDRKIELDVRAQGGGTYRVQVKDGDVKVGGKRFMLSDLRVLYGGASPRAHTSRGQVAVGLIVGLGKVKTKAAKKTLTIDLNRAIQINVRPLDPPPPVLAVEALVEARQGTRVLATVHRRTDLSGSPAPTAVAVRVGPNTVIMPSPAPPPLIDRTRVPTDEGLLDLGGTLDVDGMPRGAGDSIRPPQVAIVEVHLAPVAPAGDVIGEVRRMNGHSAMSDCVIVLPGGNQVISGGWDGAIYLWDINTGQRLRRLGENLGRVSSLAASPDGKRALSGSDDGTVRLWDLETGIQLRRHAVPAGRLGEVVTFSRDGHLAVSAGTGYWDHPRGWRTGTDFGIRLWDPDTGRTSLQLQGHTGFVFALAISPDGRRLLSTSLDKTARLWDLETGRELKRFLGHAAPVYFGTFSPDGRRIVSASEDTTARVWDAESGVELRRYTAHRGTVHFAAVMPDGKHVLTVGHTGSDAAFWEMTSGNTVHKLDLRDMSPCRGGITPDGRFAVWGGVDGSVRVFKMPVRATAAVPVEHAKDPLIRVLDGKIGDVALGGGGRYLLLTMKDPNQLAVFDVNAADVIKTIPLGSPNALVAAGAKKFLVAFPDEKLIHRWDLETLTREVSNATLPVRGRFKGLAMGSDSDGPALAAWSPDSANDNVSPTQFSFIDLKSLKVLRVGQIRTVGVQGTAATSSSGGSFIFQKSLRDQVHIRASAGGGLFGFWQTQGSLYGFMTLSVTGKDLKTVYNNETAGHFAPGPDGRTVFTGRLGRLDADGKPVGRAGPTPSSTPVTTIPTSDPAYFLTVEGSADPSQPVRASVHVAGSGDRLATIHGLDEMTGVLKDEGRLQDDFSLEKRFHFVPAARLLITIPPSNDRLVLRRLDLDRAIESLPGDYLMVVSSPNVTAKAGQPLVHQIEARSKKGGVKYTLSRGPEGLDVSPEGRLSWPLPRQFQGEDLTAVVIVGDASGRENFHTLSLHVN